MNDIKNLLQKVLLGEVYTVQGMEFIRGKMVGASNELYSQASSAYRLCRSLKDVKTKRNTWYDVCGHLRQSILFFNSRFKINQWIYENIKGIAYKFNLTIETTGLKNIYDVNVLNTMPAWFDNMRELAPLYKLERYRRQDEVLGDGSLYNMTGYTSYRSSTQKILVNASMNMPAGSTLLGCMPTGEGKSLVGLMPQYYEGEGTTIVIVPTIALAIDQSRSAEPYYQDRKHKPVAYHSELDITAKEKIFRDLTKGKVPLLYISPEAVLNSRLRDILLEGAEKGHINRLIIDEAHIVNDWGSQFRTEFQLLAVYRRKLLKASKNRLRTILLSATFTDETVRMLRELFSEGDNYIEIRGDALRPEILYFVDKNRTNKERIGKIKSILPLLPRPIILYVLRPEDAESWKEEIKEYGFRSVETFTGQITSRRKRESLIDRWNNDDIDIMIGTSAFGMGIDKKDIRTIIHCCIPESINRFYQEVGRGGRDGFPSISLLSIMESHDRKDTENFVNKKVMTIEKFVSRWDVLRSNHLERVSGNSIWVDTNVKPEYMEGISGRLSASWNEYVLLLLYRKGYIDIEDIQHDQETRTNRLLITVKDELLNDIERMEIELEDVREKEANIIYSEFKEMIRLIKHEDNSPCFAHYFRNAYSLVELSCGSCPLCRDNLIEAYRSPNFTEYYAGKDLEAKGFKYSRENQGQYERELLLMYEDQAIINNYLEEVINYLMLNNSNYIILPEDYNIGEIDFNRLVARKDKYYNLITSDETEDQYAQYNFYGNISIIYPGSSKYTQKYFHLGQALFNEGFQVTHVAKSGTRLGDGALIQERISSSTRYIKKKGGKIFVV